MYNVSLKVWNTYYLKYIDMFAIVEIYTFDLLENLSLKNKFNYILFENSWKHMWIKVLKLSLSSNNGPIQNMEAMFQTGKNINLRKDLHLEPIGSFYYECTQ
jgi:hypothetical protein